MQQANPFERVSRYQGVSTLRAGAAEQSPLAQDFTAEHAETAEKNLSPCVLSVLCGEPLPRRFEAKLRQAVTWFLSCLVPARPGQEDKVMIHTLNQTDEKTFIKRVLSKYAHTAASDHFDDCNVVDLTELLGVPDLPYIVYSLDHPSRIRRPLPPGMEWRFYGRWIAGCTCGDVLAMGAQPRGFSLDLATPLDTQVEVIEQIYQGLCDVLNHYKVRMEGGNLDINDSLEIVGMCWGTVGRDAIIRRSGAQVGDCVAITTELGIGWASYLLHHYGRFAELDGSLQETFLNYNLLPVAHSQAILEAANLPGAITSGMDLTDGPIEFFYTIRERNGWGVKIFEDLVPVPDILRHSAALLQTPPAMLALDPGYDTPRIHGYTVAPGRWSEVERTFAKHGATVYRIGQVTQEPNISWVTADGQIRPIPQFWDDQFDKANLISRWLGVIEELCP
jgi:thiamine-monophosphate kinase